MRQTKYRLFAEIAFKGNFDHIDLLSGEREVYIDSFTLNSVTFSYILTLTKNADF